MKPLYEHNQKTYKNICRMYDDGIQRVACVQPTGSGKSLLMAKLIEDNPKSRFFLLSTSHKINDQFKENLDEEMLKRLDCNIYCNMPGMKQEEMETLEPDYILLDEMHRALAKEWSKGIKVLLEMYPNAKILGLSATPIRYLDRCRNVVEELFNGNLACDMNLSQAILDGILPMARYVCGVYSYEKDMESLNKKIEKSTNSDEDKKELLREVKILKENLDRSNGVSDIFRKYIMTGNEKFVVFLKDTKHLRRMRPAIKKWFTDAGFSSLRMYEVHSKNIDKDKEFQAFKDDTEEGIKLCLSVNMLAEGLHKDINGVIMLRETASPNLYFQMIGRAFACGKKTIPLIFDLVANSQFISETADNFPNELRGEIERRKKECEKEGRDYEVGFDVDEFIVMDQFMDVVSGFKEIEGKLQGSWDLYVKALTQFKRRVGDCDVSGDHVEVVDGVSVKLGQWVSEMRKAKKGIGYHVLTEGMVSQLNQLNFIWDALKYRFENNIKAISKYYRENGKYPVANSKDSEIKKLGNYIVNEKSKIRDKNSIYPEWKMEILDKYLPDFSYETKSDRSYNNFLYYIDLYKQRYGHLNISTSKKEKIDGYNIGLVLRRFRKKCRNNKIDSEKIKQLKELGIDLGQDKNKEQFDKKMEIIRKAINNNVTINTRNKEYDGEKIYIFIMTTIKRKYKNNQLLKDEKDLIEKLMGKSLDELYCGKKAPVKIRVIDVIEDKEVGIFESKRQTSRVMQEKFGVNASNPSIEVRLIGKITTPYKGRFMFYRVDENEEATE